MNKVNSFKMIALSLTVATFGLACSTVRELQTPSKKLGGFSKVAVKVVSVENKYPEAEGILQKVVAEKLVADKVFPKVTEGVKGDLVVKITINKMRTPDDLLASGQTELDVVGDLMQGKENIGSFETLGNSGSTRTTVGSGFFKVDISEKEPKEKGITEASEQIAARLSNYFKKKL